MQYCEEMQSRSEHDRARDYCFHHELTKPRANARTVVGWLLLLETLTVLLTVGINSLFDRLGIFHSFSVSYLEVSSIVFCAGLKKSCVLLIKVYQHYASEQTRRRCTLMPSCSEYALLALQKYNVIKALYKTFIRLNNKCNGTYKIDYP